ncbi:fimbrial protein [Entomohabitans teleogrylli]|uniref:fimbrial protein n=1 Tax=Entomohabitans teleogrylli TaxID=1384589 RepID=UPI00073D209D|nr:fimbrial protein [Entomohabitans teleogrylli]
MRLKLSSGCIMLFLAADICQGSVTVAGGSVRLEGAITAPACVVSAHSQLQHIPMGHHGSHQFTGIGSYSRPTEFSITLHDCTARFGQEVAIQFLGQSDTNDPDVFRTINAQGIATGIGLALFDEQDELLAPNMPSRYYPLLNHGVTILNFKARYRATRSDIYPGIVSAWTWFTLTYP